MRNKRNVICSRYYNNRNVYILIKHFHLLYKPFTGKIRLKIGFHLQVCKY